MIGLCFIVTRIITSHLSGLNSMDQSVTSSISLEGEGVHALNLNLNSLLVTRQMTLFHQGVRMGEKLVP